MNFLPPWIIADASDENEDPGHVFFSSAQSGSLAGLQLGLLKDPSIIYRRDIYSGRSALQHAAASPRSGVDIIKWLLKNGASWSMVKDGDDGAEDLARKYGQEEKCKVLREWAVNEEYEVYYKRARGEAYPDKSQPSELLRQGGEEDNRNFCMSDVTYMNPNGAPEDEMAMICNHGGTGIMMEWERPIMRETARLLLDGMDKRNLRVLNIGFGIGMIDSYFQKARPSEHVIIEGHPVCIGWMKHNGWYDKPGVRILEGRWQDFLEPPPQDEDAQRLYLQNRAFFKIHVHGQKNRTPDIEGLTSPGHEAEEQIDLGKFDIVYFDTFNDGYPGHFAFIKHVPRLLRGPTSRFSYFNGHSARNQSQYEVYAEVQRLHHNDLGMNTEWSEVWVDGKDVWYNITRRGTDTEDDCAHLIPICSLAPTVPRTHVPNVGWNNNTEPIKSE